ncbi:MAG: LysR family transcriptional regulator [Lachnospiraceae bacterium]|nr:LysR family transcriptional regulator [Lachnospiraceae bacterium]
MTLKHLNIFSEVCRAGSITKAAEKLNMAQPAVSNAIRELETYYGVRLFDRMNRRIYITQAGQTLLNYADSILLQFEESKIALQASEAAAQIRVGSNVAFGTAHLPRVIADFGAIHPEIPVKTTILSSGRIMDDLLHNQLDLAIADDTADMEELYRIPLASDQMTALCSPDFEYLSILMKDHTPSPNRNAATTPDEVSRIFSKPEQFSLSINDFAAVPLLLREPGSGSRDLLDRLFHREKISPVIAAESSSTQALVELALRGQGVVFLLSSAARAYTDAGSLILLPIESADLTRRYSLFYHRQKYLTDSMRCFLEYLKSCFPCQ